MAEFWWDKAESLQTLVVKCLYQAVGCTPSLRPGSRAPSLHFSHHHPCARGLSKSRAPFQSLSSAPWASTWALGHAWDPAAWGARGEPGQDWQPGSGPWSCSAGGVSTPAAGRGSPDTLLMAVAPFGGHPGLGALLAAPLV